MADLVEKMLEFMSASPGQEVQTWPSFEPTASTYKVVSVDDHVVEPPDMFVGRLPARYAASGPHVVRGPDDARLLGV